MMIFPFPLTAGLVLSRYFTVFDVSPPHKTNELLTNCEGNIDLFIVCTIGNLIKVTVSSSVLH